MHLMKLSYTAYSFLTSILYSSTSSTVYIGYNDEYSDIMIVRSKYCKSTRLGPYFPILKEERNRMLVSHKCEKGSAG